MPSDTYPFLPIRLETADGRYVTTGLIPPFNVLPDVALWGSRVFKLHDEPQDKDAPIIYREAFAIAVVMTKETYERHGG